MKRSDLPLGPRGLYDNLFCLIKEHEEDDVDDLRGYFHEEAMLDAIQEAAYDFGRAVFDKVDNS